MRSLASVSVVVVLSACFEGYGFSLSWRGLLYGLVFLTGGGGFGLVVAMGGVLCVVKSVIRVLFSRGGSETSWRL